MKRKIKNLSYQEREVLTLVAHGNTGGIISGMMGISERTVRFHMSNTLKKLKAANSAHAVAIAISKKLIILNKHN